MSNLIYGVGFNDRKYKTRIEGKNVKEYSLWINVLYRCCSEIYKKNNKSYEGCRISENFKSYSFFYEWCQSQKGFLIEKWEIDKDVLLKGNKIYSEDTCVFIPPCLNLMLTKRENKRGDCKIGVSKKRKKFVAQCSVDGKSTYIGIFEKEEDAFYAYKKFKESEVKRITEIYSSELDERVYKSLVSYSGDDDD